jgi:hypothetical protein
VLTDGGRELLARAAPVFDEQLARLLSAPLTGDDLAGLAGALHTLRRSAAAGAGTPAKRT